MRDTAAADLAGAGRGSGRTIGRRGLLGGALALAATTAASAAIGRPASVAEAAQTPTEPDQPGFWLKVKGTWIRTEKLTDETLQALAEQGEPVRRLQFRISGVLTGVSKVIWSWHTAATKADSLVSTLPIYVIYANGNPPRRFIVEQAFLRDVAVRTEADEADMVLVTDLAIYGDQLRRPTKEEMGMFPRGG